MIKSVTENRISCVMEIIFLKRFSVKYTAAQRRNMSKATGPFVRTPKPMNKEDKKIFLFGVLLPYVYKMKKQTPRKMKRLNQGSIIPDLK